MTFASQITYNKVMQGGAVLAVALLWLLMPSIYTFFITIFLFWAAFHFDSRIIAGVALLFLAFIPFLLAFGRQVLAEQFAVYVFLLLAITVALQVFELTRSPTRPLPTTSAVPEHMRDTATVQQNSYTVLLNRARMDGVYPSNLFKS